MGQYFQIEGIDGAGKTGLIDWLKKVLPQDKYIFVREPGGDVFSEWCRAYLKSNAELPIEVQLGLVWSARLSLFETTIWPAVLTGKVVISDRGDASTYVYQDLDGKHIEKLPQHLSNRSKAYFKLDQIDVMAIVPTYMFLDVSAENSAIRLSQDKKRVVDHFDSSSLQVVQDRIARYAAYEKKVAPPKNPVAFWKSFDANQEAKVVNSQALDFLRNTKISLLRFES